MNKIRSLILDEIINGIHLVYGKNFVAKFLNKNSLDEDEASFLMTENPVYVSFLNSQQQIRCMGYFEEEGTSLDFISPATLKTLTEDPRFIPVKLEEALEGDYEVSFLHSFNRVSQIPNPIRPYGICIKSDLASAILLPKAAESVERNGELIYERLLLKAGVSSFDGEIFTFESRIFYFTNTEIATRYFARASEF